METRAIKSGKRIIATLHLCIPSDVKDKAELIRRILQEIKSDPVVGYMGFREKAGAKKFLTWIIGNGFSKDGLQKLASNKGKLERAVQRSFLKCYSTMPVKSPVRIFLVPTFDTFVKERMNGSSGYSPWKNTIILAIHPKPGAIRALKKTVAHEFAHVITRQYNKWETLLDSIVFDGLAENFCEDVMGGPTSPWAGALSVFLDR